MKCRRIKSSGESCKANAISGSNHCYFHCRKVKESEKRKCRSRGGRLNKHINADKRKISSFKLTGIKDVALLLGDTINTVRVELYTTDSLSTKVKIANCIGFLSGHLLNALEKSDLEKRLEELEQRLFDKHR